MTQTTTHASRTLHDLPGPKAWPIVGNVLSLRPSSIHLDLERLARQYGDTFRVFFGKQPILICANHQTIHALLRERPQGFRRPSVTDRISQEMGGLPGVFMAEGDAWRLQRRMVMAGFAPHAVKAYFPVIVKVAQRLQRRWTQAAQSDATISLTRDLKCYSGDVVASLAFGQDVNSIDSGAHALQRHIDTVLQGVARRSFTLFPYWRYVRLPQDRQLERSVQALTEQTLALITHARGELAAQPERALQPSNLLEAMIVAAQVPGSGMDDNTIAGNVSTLLIAGEDTTSHSLAWTLYLLKQNPAALTTAQHEVRALGLACEQFTIAAMDSLIYLDACIQEAMRLKPVGPFLPLEAVNDTVVEGVAVPKGTVVMCLMRSDGMKEQYVQSAQSFKPERWLAGAEQAPDKRVSTPFGSGPRTCPGRYLALLEMKVALVMLLGQFDIESVDTANGQPAQELMGFVMSPVGLMMRLRERAIE